MNSHLYRAFQIYSKPGRPGILPISHSTLHRWINSGKFPRPKLLGDGCSVWEADVIRAYIANLSDKGAS